MAIQCCFERYEKKYCLTLSQQRFLLERMTPYMKKDAYGEYTICNIYYDTDDFHLIRASLEKPVYKEKLRVRSYGVPEEGDRVFVELKKKFDGVVYKRRVTADGEAAVCRIFDPVAAFDALDGILGAPELGVIFVQKAHHRPPVSYFVLTFILSHILRRRATCKNPRTGI